KDRVRGGLRQRGPRGVQAPRAHGGHPSRARVEPRARLAREARARARPRLDRRRQPLRTRRQGHFHRRGGARGRGLEALLPRVRAREAAVMTASDSPEIAGGGPGARLVEAIGRARREGRIGIMTHVVLGYPSLDESRRIVETMARAGVDLIEVQIPFSDPTADGPVITEACQDALDGGARVADAFDLVAKAASPSAPPMLFMTYVNIAFAYRSRANGGESVPGFVRDAARAGASGLIIPDLPPERREEGYVAACRGEGIHPVFVISPNITERRLALIRENASGLVYSTSRTGTTGREMELAWDELR